MKYPASGKLEIIRLVEESHLSARLMLAKMGIPSTMFYRWYDRYLWHGEARLQDQSPRLKYVWKRIPDEVPRKVVKLALKETELSLRQLAVTFTDKESYFASQASTYRILKTHDLTTSPAFIVNKAANEFKDKTSAIDHLGQTDFTYIKFLGWGWFYLSTVLDDYSRYLISNKGLYFLDGTAPERARRITPSERGELKITSLLKSYLNDGALTVQQKGRG